MRVRLPRVTPSRVMTTTLAVAIRRTSRSRRRLRRLAVSCPASVIYDGSAQTPCSVHVTGAGGLDLTPTPSYSNNTSAGTATASYTFAGDVNHTGSSDSKDFTIEKASSTTTVSCAAGPFTFDGTSQTPCTVHVTGAGGLDLADRLRRTATTWLRARRPRVTRLRAMPTTQVAVIRALHDRQGIVDDRRSLPCERHVQRIRADTLLGRRNGCGQP